MARRPRASSRKKSGMLSLPDLSKVEGRILVPEDDFLVKVVEVTEEDGDKAPYWKWVFAVESDDKYDGAKLYFNTSLAEQSLWNLRTLLEALDVEIPDEPSEIDPEDLVDRPLMVTVEHETWEGKKRAKVVDFHAAEDDGRPERRPSRDREERSERGERRRPSRDREERAPRGGKKPKKVTADEVNDMDQDELEDVIKDFDLDVDLEKFRTPRKMRAAVIDALTEADALEE